MRLNGAAVDGIVGTRSRSQYDLRTLYSTFDVLHLLREAVRETLNPKSNSVPSLRNNTPASDLPTHAKEDSRIRERALTILLGLQASNTLALSIAGGWYSHYGFGAPVRTVPLLFVPFYYVVKQDGLTRQARDEHNIGETICHFLQTVRCVLRATIDGRVFELGTDKTWEENPGPIRYASIYVGVSHDARLETPGWDLPGTNAHIEFQHAYHRVDVEPHLSNTTAVFITTSYGQLDVTTTTLMTGLVVFVLQSTAGYRPAPDEHWTPAVAANESSSFKLRSTRLAAAVLANCFYSPLLRSAFENLKGRASVYSCQDTFRRTGIAARMSLLFC